MERFARPLPGNGYLCAMPFSLVTWSLLAASLAAADPAVLRQAVLGSDTARIERGRTFQVLALSGPGGTQRTTMPHPVHSLELGDLDGDGNVDVLVGVTKSNRHDPEMRRRIQVWTRGEDRLRPVWLGTKLVAELRECRIAARQDGRKDLFSLETRGKDWLVARLKWSGFGFVMDSTLVDGADSSRATAAWRDAR